MSFLSDVGNFVKGAVDTAVHVAETAVGAAGELASSPLGQMALSAIFPPAALVTSFSGLAQGVLGGSINDAMQILQKTAGMPKFIADGVAGVIKDVLGQLQQTSHPDCDAAVAQRVGGDLLKCGAGVTGGLVDFIKDAIERAGGGKSQGKNSWLGIIMQALAKVAGDKAKDMVNLSKQMQEAGSGSDGDKAANAQSLNAQFATASAEFNQITNNMNTFIKQVTDGITKLASRQ